MKNSFKTLSLAAILVSGVGFAVVGSGCASTSTKESTGEYVDDSAITVKVKAALVKDDTVKAREVNVETFKGIVQLSGFVTTTEEKAQAGRVARAVQGVTEVKNNITIK
jgi:hyperosmotically inducible protein